MVLSKVMIFPAREEGVLVPDCGAGEIRSHPDASMLSEYARMISANRSQK